MYILICNKSIIPKKIEIRFYLKKVEQYIHSSLRCFECIKYWHHKKTTEDVQHVEDVTKKAPDHMNEDCPNKNKGSNCQDRHPNFSRSCNMYRRETKIIEKKYRRNITFLEARKIVESNTKDNPNTNVTQKVNPICNTKNQSDGYKALNQKLV